MCGLGERRDAGDRGNVCSWRTVTLLQPLAAQCRAGRVAKGPAGITAQAWGGLTRLDCGVNESQPSNHIPRICTVNRSVFHFPRRFLLVPPTSSLNHFRTISGPQVCKGQVKNTRVISRSVILRSKQMCCAGRTPTQKSLAALLALMTLFFTAERTWKRRPRPAARSPGEPEDRNHGLKSRSMKRRDIFYLYERKAKCVPLNTTCCVVLLCKCVGAHCFRSYRLQL